MCVCFCSRNVHVLKMQMCTYACACRVCVHHRAPHMRCAYVINISPVGEWCGKMVKTVSAALHAHTASTSHMPYLPNSGHSECHAHILYQRQAHATCVTCKCTCGPCLQHQGKQTKPHCTSAPHMQTVCVRHTCITCTKTLHTWHMQTHTPSVPLHAGARGA